MSLFKSLPLILLSLNCGATTRALIISGGWNTEENSIAYYNSAKSFHQGLTKAGVKRENISTLYADGKANTQNATQLNRPFYGLGYLANEEAVSSPASFYADTRSDITAPADKASILRKIGELAKVAGKDDQVVLLITDHGTKEGELVLWKPEYFSFKELEAELSKINPETRIKIVSNICFGEQLIKLTKKNVCVVTTGDQEGLTHGNDNDDPFIEGFAKELKTSSFPNFDVSFASAIKSDHPKNTVHKSSLDFLIEQQNKRLLSKQNKNCISSSNGGANLKSLAAEIQDYISNPKYAENDNHSRILITKLQQISSLLTDAKSKYSQYKTEKYEQEVRRLKQAWTSATEKEQDKIRPQLTDNYRKLEMERAYQAKRLDDLDWQQKMALSELKFLRQANQEELNLYKSVRRCMDEKL